MMDKRRKRFDHIASDQGSNKNQLVCREDYKKNSAIKDIDFLQTDLFLHLFSN